MSLLVEGLGSDSWTSGSHARCVTLQAHPIRSVVKAQRHYGRARRRLKLGALTGGPSSKQGYSLSLAKC
eukprot:scaffold73196_cov14-Tisochrysis_lutea.AAC.1